jgi:hypothetical protein
MRPSIWKRLRTIYRKLMSMWDYGPYIKLAAGGRLL